MKGIDISEFQDNVNYQKLKEQGIEFAIIRCGFGKNANQKDSKFEEHYLGLKYAGIKVGAYLYSYITDINNAKLEAENCLRFIKGKKFDLPIFYDVEDKSITLNRADLTKACKVFCDILIKNGYDAGIYANLSWFKSKINVKELENYKIWLAQWGLSKHQANFKVDFWQYTNKGQINGISGNVDMNISYTQPVENSVDNLYFEIGKTYTIQVDALNVRIGAGINKARKLFNSLTPDGQKHAYSNGCLKKETKVTCLEIKKINNEIWIRIPSGWVAGYYNNKYYIK